MKIPKLEIPDVASVKYGDEEVAQRLHAISILSLHALNMASLPVSEKKNLNRGFLEGQKTFLEMGAITQLTYDLIRELVEASSAFCADYTDEF